MNGFIDLPAAILIAIALIKAYDFYAAKASHTKKNRLTQADA